jgi:hypothetical protein
MGGQMDQNLAYLDAQARVRNLELDGSPRRYCIAHDPVTGQDDVRDIGPLTRDRWPDAFAGQPIRPPVLQEWVQALPFMQQTVLLTAIRGPDNIRKFHPIKPLHRWFRRCVLVSAFEGAAITGPFTPGGGSFTGPVYKGAELCNMMAWASVGRPGNVDSPEVIEAANRDWEKVIVPAVDAFLEARDELPHHFLMHAIHAFEIIGYKHSDPRIRAFWEQVYMRNVHACHMWPESVFELDKRLGDSKEDWQARADVSETRGCTVSCSD